MRIVRSVLFSLFLITFLATNAHANEQPEGPAQQAVEQWFSNSFRRANVMLWQTFYDTNSPYMVAVANYSKEGNAIYVAMAVFRKEQNGTYTFVKLAKPADEVFGQTESITFGKGSATVLAKVPQPGDPRCCPSGQKTWKITLP